MPHKKKEILFDFVVTPEKKTIRGTPARFSFLFRSSQCFTGALKLAQGLSFSPRRFEKQKGRSCQNSSSPPTSLLAGGTSGDNSSPVRGGSATLLAAAV
jgi:hypothetical protein